MDDKSLRQQIIDELDFDPRINAANIAVTVDKGVVTLGGHVGSYSERHDAERAAQKIKGVRAVIEEIEVRLPYDKAPADEITAKQVANVLEWNILIPRDKVHAKVEKGWVTLSGKVDWQYQRDEAAAAIKRLTGIVGVTNLVEVAPKAEALDAKVIKNKIESALKRNAQLESDGIRVSVANHKVTLEGQVSAWSERTIAERAAWSAPGVRAVEDRLALG